MANEVEIRVTADTKRAEQQLKGLKGSLNKFSQNAKVGGAALTAFGAVGAVAFKKLISSSKDQEIGITKLNQALINVGHTYGDNEAAIEKVIDATQRKTNFGDEQQREALRTLITIGGEYEGSLEALQVATDLAAGANMSLEGASLLLAKALAGETSALGRYGIKLDDGASKTEIMAALTKQFGGAAEASADPMTQLGNRMGDVGQVLGDVLIPFVDKAAVFLEKLATKLTELNPNVVKIGAIVVAAAVAFAMIGGPILLLIGFLPMLAVGFGAVSAAALPITLVIIGIAAAVAALVVVWKNWDKIKEIFSRVVGFIFRIYNSKLGWLLPGGALIKALIFLKNNWDTIWDGMKSTFLTVSGAIVSGIKGIVNVFIDSINFMIRALNMIRIPGFSIGGKKFGGFGIDIMEIRRMAKGGIVTRPTLAMIGEAGPEAVVPLGRGSGIAPVYNFNISGNTVFGEMDFKRLVVDAVTDSHRRGGLPFLGKA